ncbi:hypothetical protein MRX96_037002 [Rhipicephalus microplus]
MASTRSAPPRAGTLMTVGRSTVSFWSPAITFAGRVCGESSHSFAAVLIRRPRRGKDCSARSQKKEACWHGAGVVDAPHSAVNACDPVFVLAGRVSGGPAESSAFIAWPTVFLVAQRALT